jgi:hypothetical protein
LQKLIDDGLCDGEWYDGVENSFVAQIKCNIKSIETKPPDDYISDSGITKWTEYKIEEVNK